MSPSRPAEGARISSFARVVAETNTTNLQLLRAIENTVAWLAWVERNAKTDVAYALQLGDALRTSAGDQIIDGDGSLCAQLEATEVVLGEFHSVLGKKKSASETARELKGDHRECVVEGYERAMAAIADLHNAMAELKWTIGEYDADLETPSGPAISDPEELRKYLASI